jgi:uncharacterized membrane protein
MTTRTIRSPVEWVASQIMHILRGLLAIGRALYHVGETWGVPAPSVRRITYSDLRRALTLGYRDFTAYRGDVFFLLLLYPVLSFLLARVAFGMSLLPLLFPFASGLIILGPVAAVGLYEMSRQREHRQKINWFNGFEVIYRPAFGSILLLSLLLVAIFALWLAAAWGIFLHTVGPIGPTSVGAFVHDVLATDAGHAMIVIGIGVGFLFAMVAMVISVVSLPLLVDHDVGLDSAVKTSFRAVTANPLPIAAWSGIVVLGLIIGAVPLFLGLVVILPVLGHATWHLYQKLVEREDRADQPGVSR